MPAFNKQLYIPFKNSTNAIYIILFLLCILKQVHNLEKSSAYSIQLRFLSANSTTTTNSHIINYPKCESNSDCSYNGICNISAGNCDCDYGYETYLSQKLINAKIQNINTTDFTPSNTTEIGVYAINLTTSDIKFCNYKLKSQLSALMLSMFLGFGSEHFYLENNSLGAAKFVFYFFCFAVNIALFLVYKCMPNGKTFVHHLSVYEATYLGCGFIYIFLWNIYDWVHIGYDMFLDGNGIKMLKWS